MYNRDICNVLIILCSFKNCNLFFVEVFVGLWYYHLRSVKQVRMRKKPNLIPRLERCAHVLENSPEALRGSWLDACPVYDEVHVELGCGKGRFTCDMAEQNPRVLFAAVEKVPDALVVAMERACERGLTNVRFLAKDAASLAEYFAPAEVGRIYINFPDPWPKKKQFKRRLTAPSFQKLCFDALKPGGEIWFKTDNVPLFEWSLEQYEGCGWTLKDVSRDWHDTVMTDYEAKFREQGVKINRLVAVKGDVFRCG